MKRLHLLSLLTLLTFGSSAQPVAKEDYARAVSFLWENVNNKKAFNLTTVPNWLPDSTGVWFTHHSPAEKTYQLVLFKPLKRQPLFDHTAVATKLSELLTEPIDPKQLPLENIRYVKSTRIEFIAKGKRFLWNGATVSLNEEKEEPRNVMVSKSPDGKWIAYSENYNLYIKSTTDGTVKQLSTKGYKNYEYASYYGWSDIIEGENGERPKRFTVNWSPDSKYIQTSICDLRFGRKMYLLDWSVDTLYRARLLSFT